MHIAVLALLPFLCSAFKPITTRVVSRALVFDILSIKRHYLYSLITLYFLFLFFPHFFLFSISKSAINSDSLPGTAENGVKAVVMKPLFTAASVVLGMAAVAVADEVATIAPPVASAEKVELGPPPVDFGLKYDYYTDCQLVVNHMRYATQMEKGNPNLINVASKTKDEMNEFVSFYRRSGGVNGKQSFSLLYTSINVLAGHYTSYGTKFPVPEKRKKRLLQEYNDIEKNIRKKR